MKQCTNCGTELPFEQLTYCEKCIHEMAEESMNNLRKISLYLEATR
jgi:uncharacterized membrane protein YvbJ